MVADNTAATATKPSWEKTDEEIASMVGVTVEDLHKAEEIMRRDPAVASRVESGEVTLDEALSLLNSEVAVATKPKTITLGGLVYEIDKFFDLWHFRLSPELGWTACSEEMVDIIESAGGSNA